MNRGFVVVGLLGWVVVLVGCSTSYSKQETKLRNKFIRDAAGKCLKHGGKPGHDILTMGEYVSCKKGNNVIFRVQVP